MTAWQGPPGSVSREVLSHTVGPGEDGITLRSLLRTRLRVSRGLLRKLKGCWGIHVDGHPARVSRVLRAGERVQLLLPDRPVHVAPEALPLEILFEDEDLLVLNKPPGMVVHPAGGHRAGTLANAVVHHLAASGGACAPRPVHRLDKDTSGAIVFAKHHYSHQHLARQLSEGLLRREYVAVVAGLVPEPGRVDLPLSRGGPGVLPRVVAPPRGKPPQGGLPSDGAPPPQEVGSQRGRPAVTHFEPLQRWAVRLPAAAGPAREPAEVVGATLVRVWLETGRTHQIRLHMAAIGHPLLGDAVHGIACPALIGRQALHALRVSLRQPRRGEALLCEAPPPPDWEALMRGLGPPI